MRSYWIRISLGALLVFALGMGIISFARESKREVAAAIASGAAQLAGMDLPFRVDGRSFGRIQQLDVRGADRGTDRWMHVVVKVDDSIPLDRVPGCDFTLRRSGRDLDVQHGFICAPAGEAGLAPAGEVVVQPGGARRVLLLPAEAVAEAAAQAGGGGAVNVQADSHGAVIRITDASGRPIFQVHADSLGAQVRVRDAQGREVVKVDATKPAHGQAGAPKRP